MRLYLLLTFCYFSLANAFSQDNFGIFESDYSTLNAIQINPANGVLSKSYLDFNIIGAKAFANNNLIFIARRDYRFRDILQQNFEKLNLQYDLDNNKNKGFASSVINLPGVAWSAADHSWGFTMNIKSFMDIRNVPNYLVDFFLNDNLPGLGLYQAKNMRMGGVSYLEIGGSYSTNWFKQGNLIMSAGGQLNYLIGLAGAAGIISKANLSIDSSGIFLNEYAGEYMYSDYGWNTGRGISTHLGINVAWMEKAVIGYLHNMPSSQCQCYDHRLKIGASLIDFGWVNFKKTLHYRNYAEAATKPSTTTTDLDKYIAESIVDGEQTVWSKSKIYLPGAVSIQADYKVQDKLFLSGSYIHGFRKGKFRFGVQRPRVINFTPRFETERFEISLPLSLYEWNRPQLGFAVRLFNNLIIGTDKLGPITGGANLYGADLYFHLKYTMIKNPDCREAHKRLKLREWHHKKHAPSSQKSESNKPGRR